MEVFVAPEGVDSNSGSIEKPLRTLDQARKMLRGKGGTVFIREGVYFITSPLMLGPEDQNIRFTSYQNEKVMLTGAVILQGSQFCPVSGQTALRIQPHVRTKVLCYDLKESGIYEYGKMQPYGIGFPTKTAAPQLFIDNQAQTIARWPNEGFAVISEVLDQSEADTHRFRCQEAPVERWKDAKDLWVYGYFKWEWADCTLSVSKLDGDVIQTAQSSIFGMDKGKPFYVFHLLEELDQPGEWYLDHETGMLYLYPPYDLAEAEIKLSIGETPFFCLEGASGIVLDGIEMECTRANAVTIKGGQDNQVTGCRISKIGQSAVIIGEIDRGAGLDLGTIGEGGDGGKNNGVQNCEIFDIGMGGITLAGGNRQTLEPCGNYAINNHIYRYATIARTYRPAVSMFGVGCLASHNEIHEAFHNAIAYEGNDHIIEYNNIYDVCRLADDSGAIYSLRDWSFRGNEIRFNYIHDIPKGIGGQDNFGIYCDDCMSGAHIYANVFARLPVAVFTHGGRDHVIENNLMIDCDAPLRLYNLWVDFIPQQKENLEMRLKSVPYKGETWAKKYPKLTNILEDSPMLPKGTLVQRNVFLTIEKEKCSPGVYDMTVLQTVRMEENIHFVKPYNPGFIDAENQNYLLKGDSEIYQKIKGFVSIPFDKIGRE